MEPKDYAEVLVRNRQVRTPFPACPCGTPGSIETVLGSSRLAATVSGVLGNPARSCPRFGISRTPGLLERQLFGFVQTQPLLPPGQPLVAGITAGQAARMFSVFCGESDAVMCIQHPIYFTGSIGGKVQVPSRIASRGR